MRAETKKRAIQISKDILLAVGATALVGGVIVFPGLAQMIRWIENSQRYEKKSAHRSFKRLQKYGYLTVSKERDGYQLALTKKGNTLLNRYQISDLRVRTPGRWDRTWRLVMFDVPESKKSIRDAIRRRLYSLGFVSVQKSVFVHPYNCRDIVEILRSYYHLNPGQLYIFEGKVVEGEEYLLKHFKL